ncbi:GH39 family glycosyl hydrolase [Motilibacter deserti]|uniref:Cellulase family glycosylhydrolase n=1 Tax=Motilibacter deserti TaxID=2714956 RepID=A0ABX0GVA0_9ACTN|nr:glycosyl hydrolase [Motilibacter deserti]NHC14076.1 cellulase family glycosylhydrolase [Motilibacter deserti]
MQFRRPGSLVPDRSDQVVDGRAAAGSAARPRRPHRVAAVVAAATALPLVAALPASAATVTVPKAYFGMHQSSVSSGVFPGAPVGAVRLWDVGAQWRDVEPSRGTWDFTKLDRAVTTSRAKGAQPMIVLGQTPTWAASKPSLAGPYGPGAASMPRSITYWREYVTKVAQRYKGRVRAYQIWNEPNVETFWTGTAAQMVTLTREARAIIKRYDRNATVVSPGFATRRPTNIPWMSSYFRAGGGKYVDVVALHLYPAPTAGPEGSITLLNKAKQALKKARVSKPIWNTEINYGAGYNGAPPRAYADSTAAAYVSRTLLLNASNGVSRVFWYGWDTRGFLGIDLSRQSRQTRAGQAYRITQKWMQGARLQSCTVDSRRTYTCVLRYSSRSYAKVIWNPSRAIRVRTTKYTTGVEFVNGRVLRFRGARNQTVIASPVLIRSTRV